MLQLLQNLPAFVTAHWAQLLALGAATTAFNRFVQFVAGFIAKRAAPGGKVANVAARVANVCQTVTVDIVSFIAELAGFLGKGPRANAVAKTGIVLLLVLALPGCASFLHWSPAALPDVAALCALSGDVQPQLDALAIKYGVPTAYVEEAFKLACAETAKTAPNEAKHAGLSAARASATAAHKMGAKFEAQP